MVTLACRVSTRVVGSRLTSQAVHTHPHCRGRPTKAKTGLLAPSYMSGIVAKELANKNVVVSEKDSLAFGDHEYAAQIRALLPK